MAVKTSKIEAELTKATGMTRKARESTSKWFARLTRAAVDLPEAKWKKLSDEAQVWVNYNVQSLNLKEELADFDDDTDALRTALEEEDEDDDADLEDEDDADADADDADEEEDADDEEDLEEEEDADEAEDTDEDTDEEEEDEEDDDEEEDEAPAPKKKAPKKKASSAEPKKRGASARFLELVLQNPTARPDEVLEMVEGEGFTMSRNTAGVTYYSIAGVIREAGKQGLLKRKNFEVGFKKAEAAKKAEEAEEAEETPKVSPKKKRTPQKK